MSGFSVVDLKSRCCAFTLTLVLGSLLTVSIALSVASAATTISVGLVWGGTDVFHGVFPALADAYEEANPGIEIEYLLGWSQDKVLAAAAGGVLPDIIFTGVNNPDIRGILVPLDEMMERRGIRLDDFLPGSVAQMHIDGKTWALQTFIDPNFPLIYNKTLFGAAGLDPEDPPATVAEFDAMFPKLTKFDGNGTMTQVAFPVWGFPFKSTTWAYTFGAQAWEGNTQEGRLGLTSPRMIAAYEWLQNYYQQYSAAARPFLGVPEGSVGNFPDHMNRMSEGKQAMNYWITATLGTLKEMAPIYEWGVAPPFKHEQFATSPPIWFGGWRAGVTTHSEHPLEAFDFLAFMAHSPEGQTIMSSVGEQFPPTKESPGFLALVEREPLWGNFIPAIQQATAAPAGYYLDLDFHFGVAEQMIFLEGAAPAVALAEADRLTRAEAREKGIDILN